MHNIFISIFPCLSLLNEEHYEKEQTEKKLRHEHFADYLVIFKRQ